MGSLFFMCKKEVLFVALTGKRERFCIEYSKTGNAKLAYIKAGYKCKNENVAKSLGSRMLSKDDVKQRLKELSDEVKNDNIASIQEIQEFWTKVLRNEEVEEVVGVAEGGPFRLSKNCNIKDRIKAAELLGRVNGIFIDNVNVTGTVPVTFVDDLEDDPEAEK